MKAPALALALVLISSLAYGQSADENEICSLINQRRVQNGHQPLDFSLDLYAAAKSHSNDMAENECFQHNSCNGENWVKRVGRYYPDWVALGEVITYTTRPVDAVQGWMNSDTHRAILLSDNMTEFGCASTEGATNFGNFDLATVDFGSRGFRPIPTGTPNPSATPTPTPPPVGTERFTVRRDHGKTVVYGYVTIPSGAKLDAAVSVEFDGVLVTAISDQCVKPRSRGAVSDRKCPGPSFQLSPAGIPRYRFRVEVAGVYSPAKVKVSFAGQAWEL